MAPEDLQSPDRLVAERLRAAGVEVRMTRKGRLHTADFRPAPHAVTLPLLESLATLERVKEVHLAGADAGDDCLAVLAQLASLETLDLENTAVTDAGLANLAGMQQLKLLVLRGARATRDAVAELRKRMIGTRIVY